LKYLEIKMAKHKEKKIKKSSKVISVIKKDKEPKKK